MEVQERSSGNLKVEEASCGYLEVQEASSGYLMQAEANLEVQAVGICMCRREEGRGGGKAEGIWM